MKKIIILLSFFSILSGSSNIQVVANIPYTICFVVCDKEYIHDFYKEELKDIYKLRPNIEGYYFDGWYYDLDYKEIYSHLNDHEDYFTLYAKLSKNKPFEIVFTAV